MGIVDFLILLNSYVDIASWRLAICHFAPEIISLVIWYALYRKRINLKIILHKLRDVPPPNHKRILHFLAFAILVVPVLYTTIITIISKSQNTVNKLAYGYEVKNRFVGILILFTKRMIHIIMLPTFHCLILLLYCVICLRCSYFIRHLAQEVAHISLQRSLDLPNKSVSSGAKQRWTIS
ncbi:hypothetical protein TNCV_4135111 [Trichonephila clavipes]|nr:hypothetical protein TNCV_4135111 [Trichonephila clavipes]